MYNGYLDKHERKVLYVYMFQTIRVFGPYAYFFKIPIRSDRTRTVCLVLRDYRGFKNILQINVIRIYNILKKVNYRNCTI